METSTKAIYLAR